MNKHLSDIQVSKKRMSPFFDCTYAVNLTSGRKSEKSYSKSKEATYFSILLHITPDVSHTDQMAYVLTVFLRKILGTQCGLVGTRFLWFCGLDSGPQNALKTLVLRYVKVEKSEAQKIKESFFLMYGKAVEYITNSILNELHTNDLDVMMCRGQAYDNASTISGIHSGAQRRIKEINWKSMSVHCGESLAQSCGRSCGGVFRSLWYHSFVTKCDIICSLACRALQKVCQPVETYLLHLQWHSYLISIHNTHVDFCTASNIHKNILAVMLTSVGWGRQNHRNPGAASYAATPLSPCHRQLHGISKCLRTKLLLVESTYKCKCCGMPNPPQHSMVELESLLFGLSDPLSNSLFTLRNAKSAATQVLHIGIWLTLINV